MIMVIGGRVSIRVVIAGVVSLCWLLLLLLFYLVDVIEQILMEKGGESRKEKGCKVQIH